MSDTMTEQKFKSEMRRAETMRRIAEPERAEYWAGYIRGLRRAYHGEKFGDPGEHEKWLSLINDRDEWRRQRGLGYRDGLAGREIVTVDQANAEHADALNGRR